MYKHLAILVIITIVTSTPTLHAWPYSPVTPCPFNFDESAGVIPLNFDSQFQEFRARISNAVNLKEPDNPDRLKLINRIRALNDRIRNLSPDERNSLESDLYYLHDKPRLVTELMPRRSDFRAQMTLSHIQARSGEWEDAIRNCENAMDNPRPAVATPGVTVAQAKWLANVDECYFRWLRVKRKEKGVDREKVDVPQIFGSKEPVQFVNDAGQYEPSKLAEKERAKLPKDAIAIVQQMILWHPEDNGLMWLLAELYATEGKFREAFTLIDICTQNGYTFPRLMEHRKAINEAFEKMPKPKDDDTLLAAPPSDETPRETGFFTMVSRPQFFVATGVFALFASVLIIMQLRSIARRLRARKP